MRLNRLLIVNISMHGLPDAASDAAFFPAGSVKSNFLCNIGYGDTAKMRPRAPRLAFDEVCRIE
jgi:3-hydroxypropanoate dehydrogenase